MFRPLARETTQSEYIDHPGLAGPELAESLRDIGRLNRLGPTRSLLICAAPFFERFARLGDPGPLRVLDLGTGGADIPVALLSWARRRRYAVRVLGLDVGPSVLACAAAAVGGHPEIRLVAADALHPPIRAKSVDLALCSLTLHHLPEGSVIELFRVMAEVSRLGFVVSDLYRSRLAYAAAWIATRAISGNRLTRHDGPLSARRAYTKQELERLARAAGLPEMRWRRVPAFRVIGVYERP
jgi:ubiquinone/menaquinone biosynthesis C-methylase UbiE